MLGEVGQDAVGLDVRRRGPDGHLQGDVAGILAGHVPAGAVDAAQGLIVPLVAEVEEGGQVGVGLQVHVASLAAVAAVGAAARHILFLAEGDGAVAAVARFYVYDYFVYEHKIPSFRCAMGQEGHGLKPTVVESSSLI